jgi:hypothetical protein
MRRMLLVVRVLQGVADGNQEGDQRSSVALDDPDNHGSYKWF